MRLNDMEGIKWTAPNLADEVGEYTENQYTQNAFTKRGIVFHNDEEVLNFLKNGELVEITRDELLKAKTDNLTLTDKDFDDELADPEYRSSYDSMQSATSLPAPILIKFQDGTYYGYAGNRRMNTAWRKGVPLKVWLVNG